MGGGIFLIDQSIYKWKLETFKTSIIKNNKNDSILKI